MRKGKNELDYIWLGYCYWLVYRAYTWIAGRYRHFGA